jgi:hypothetical protein
VIPVALAAEPADFDTKVRQPGLAAIDELVGRTPRLTRTGPRRKTVADTENKVPADKFPPFWRRILGDMLVCYERRCAYLAMYFEPATGNPTVDHALPKSYAWDKVYEWSNYRLCAAIINSRKGELLSFVDPFLVEPGWFELDLATFHVDRGAQAPRTRWAKVDATLSLLNQTDCLNQREEYVTAYRDGDISISYLERRAPFIALELRRQGQLVRGDV